MLMSRLWSHLSPAWLDTGTILPEYQLKCFDWLSQDHIISIDAVMMNATAVTLNNETDKELFWAMKGAGSSFAVSLSSHAGLPL